VAVARYRPGCNLTVPVGAQPEMLELLSIDTDAGMRLDRFVTAHCPELSRLRVQELIDSGLILVNGKPAKSSEKLRGGELITVASSKRD
jgi:23S rRNA pseudouridine1911/1915/1917 synthase